MKKKSSIYSKLFGLTSHLGDSGTKNNPTACNREGIVPEIKSDLFFYQWIMFMQWRTKKKKLPINAKVRQLMKPPMIYMSEEPQATINCMLDEAKLC